MLYRLVRTYLTPYAAMLGVLLVLQVIATLASLYLPSLFGRIIDEGVAVGDTSFIIRTGGVMLVISFVQIIATIGATRIGAQTSASLGRDVRSSVFHRVGKFSAQELSKFGAPTLTRSRIADQSGRQAARVPYFAFMRFERNTVSGKTNSAPVPTTVAIAAPVTPSGVTPGTPGRPNRGKPSSP